MALTDEQIQNLEAGDKLVRVSGGTAKVHDAVHATNEQVAIEVDSKWGDGTRVVKIKAQIKNHFVDIKS